MILRHRDRDILRFAWVEPFGVSSATIARRLKVLQEAGKVQRVGSRKAGTWRVNS